MIFWKGSNGKHSKLSNRQISKNRFKTDEFYLFRSADKRVLSAPKLILFVCLKGIVFVRYAEPGVKAHKSALRQTEKALKGIDRVARLRAVVTGYGNFRDFRIHPGYIRKIAQNILDAVPL